MRKILIFILLITAFGCNMQAQITPILTRFEFREGLQMPDTADADFGGSVLFQDSIKIGVFVDHPSDFNEGYRGVLTPDDEYLFFKMTETQGGLATNNYGFGHNSLKNSIGFSINGFGHLALENNNAWHANGFGFEALQNNIGESNNGFGFRALKNSTGNNSSGFGHHVLENNTGWQAYGFGTSSLRANTANNVCAFGHLSLENNTGAHANGMGFRALRENTGSNSNGFGSFSLENNDGSNNSAFGHSAASGAATGFSNATAIGANSVLNASNSVTLGDGNVTSVYFANNLFWDDGDILTGGATFTEQVLFDSENGTISRASIPRYELLSTRSDAGVNSNIGFIRYNWAEQDQEMARFDVRTDGGSPGSRGSQWRIQVRTAGGGLIDALNLRNTGDAEFLNDITLGGDITATGTVSGATATAPDEFVTKANIPNSVDTTATDGTASFTLPARRGFYSFTGSTATWTLPAVAGNTGIVFFIKNKGSGTLTINADGGNNEIYDTSAVNTYDVTAGGSVMLQNDGTHWNIHE